jgi:cytochrome c-type biogenesis protein CcmF
MAGKILIYIAFFSAVISMGLFYLTHTGKTQYLKKARLFFHISAVSILAVAAFMLYLILTHQFQYAYVWEYSNRDLPLALLLSTFYAGQEGSFMLWTLFTAIIGIFLLNYVSKGQRMEPQVMMIYTLVIAFLSLIMILKTPFSSLYEMFPNEVKVGFVPEDGRGLNPLLQNFWMAIHPPILFSGFSSLAVPFSFAVAALIKNKYQQWISIASPWLLFSSGILGLGIMMGGYWAYGVLGWGGYWGWDPVENSSLVPWIISVAAVHTMIAQRKTGGYIKTNLILSILTYLLVLYSTFLTRSGILGDASVHSFSAPGAEVYWALIIFVGSFLLIAVGSILFRLKELGGLKKHTTEFVTKETALFIGSMLLCVSALIVFIGTSTPIISKNTVAADFYNQWNLPIAILIAFFTGISIFLQWKTTPLGDFFKKISLHLIISVVVTIFLIIIGVRDVLMILLAFTSVFTIAVNAQILIKIISQGQFKFGGALGHIGIALLFLGIIGSARYSLEENIELPIGVPKAAFGYTFTFLGPERFEDMNNKSDSKYLNVRVEKDNKEIIMKPVQYMNTIGNGISSEPDIANFATNDLYLSPKNYSEAEFFHKQYEVKKGDKVDFEGVEVQFLDFSNKGANMKGGDAPIGAILKVTSGNKTDTIIPTIKLGQGNPQYTAGQIASKPTYNFFLEKVNVSGENTTASLYFEDSARRSSAETLVLSVSVKPFINVLWTGTVVLVLGFFFSVYKRGRDLTKAKPEEEKQKS